MTAFPEEQRAEQPGGSLRTYIDTVRRRRWIVLATLFVAVLVAAIVSLLQPATYRSEMKLVIGQGQSLFQVPNGNMIQPFTATMSDLVKSNVVATRVIGNLDLAETPEDLLKNLGVSINPDTAVLTARYDAGDPRQATRVLQQIGVVFSQLVKQRFGQPVKSSAAQAPPITATVFDPAHPLPGKVSPRPLRNVLIAAVLGFLLGLIAAFLRDHFDRGLRTREAVESAFGLPVIGQIPFEQHRQGRRTVAWSGSGEIAEAYRGLRANLHYLAVRRPLRTILVTSATPEQGKTTVAANLAVAIARSGASIVVIEADLRRPRLDSALGVPSAGPGLTSVLVGAAEPEQAMREVPLLESPAGQPGRVAFVPSGPLPPNPTELLASDRMREFLERLAVTFDYVVIDSPPMLPVADALELAGHVDGVVVAVRRNRATSDDAQEVRSIGNRTGINLLGVVFTDVPPAKGYGVYGDEREVRAREPRQPPAEAAVERRRQPAVSKEG